MNSEIKTACSKVILHVHTAHKPISVCTGYLPIKPNFLKEEKIPVDKTVYNRSNCVKLFLESC